MTFFVKKMIFFVIFVVSTQYKMLTLHKYWCKPVWMGANSQTVN